MKIIQNNATLQRVLCIFPQQVSFLICGLNLVKICGAMTDFKSLLEVTDSMVVTDAPIVTASGIDSERKQPNLTRSIADDVADNDDCRQLNS